MQTAEALKYAALAMAEIGLAFVIGCAQPDFKGEASRERYPASNESRLNVKMSGYAEKDMKKLTDELGELVKNLPESKEPYHMRDIKLSGDKGTVSLAITEESGWLPKEYVKMLNEARDKGYLLSYDFYEDGAVKDTNGNGKLDEGESKLSRPVVVIRKTDGTYCIGAYENADDGKLKSGLPVINVIKYNTRDSLGKAIQCVNGIARNYAKPANCGDGELIRNPRVRIRTKEGIKEVVAAFALKIEGKTIIYFDKELEIYLKDALPKYYRVLKE